MIAIPNEEPVALAKPPFLRRVRIRGYKSIAFCDVTLEPLTILVGRNATGKSNFLDALAFLRDVVVRGVHEAVKLHGGRDAVLCQLTMSSFVCIEIELAYQAQPDDESWIGIFTIEIALPALGSPRIAREQLRLETGTSNRWASYAVEGGRVTWDGDSLAFPAHEWLNQDKVLLGMYLAPPFIELHDRLACVQMYNFSPATIRLPQRPVPGGYLERDGSNLASVIETTRETDGCAVDRAERYLCSITDNTSFSEVVRSGGYETLQFRVAMESQGAPVSVELPAASMSDGTLRVFAALMAAFQLASPHGSPSLVAIEEPETALHPAAMRALVAALDEATLRTQILLTTHSPDLLDAAEIKPSNVRVVQMIDGRTVIGPVDEASVSIVRDHLSTLGSLERELQLAPDIHDLERQEQLERRGPTS